MRVIVLLNVSAGSEGALKSERDAESVRTAFRGAGVEPDVRPLRGDQVHEAALGLAQDEGADGKLVIAAAGGDGTQNAVASALAGTPTAMGVLPMGTLNHFAKDLGIGTDLAGAARVIATGRPRAIDVAQVNGRVFINNSSIGLYPQVVRRRDQMRERLGHGKWYAMLRAVIAIFRRFPLVRLRL